jgi:hypothetical protein
MGPQSTRDMFPPQLSMLCYRPDSPTPLGKGGFQFGLTHYEGNTFEYSLSIRDHMHSSLGRLWVDRSTAEHIAQIGSQLPLIYFIDEETLRSEIDLKYGLSDSLDIALQIPLQSRTSGFLDGLIEDVHRLGFEQYGRSDIAKNRITTFVVQKGQVTYYNEEGSWRKWENPTLSLSQLVFDQNRLRVSLSTHVQLPLTSNEGHKARCEYSLQANARWELNSSNIFYFGFGHISRERSAELNELNLETFNHGQGANIGWEYRDGSRIRPFAQLYYQSGYFKNDPNDSLNRYSILCDLGFHWQIYTKTVLTLSYINNLSHNQNTADMSLAFRIAYRL